MNAHVDELELDPSRGPGVGGRAGVAPAGCHTHGESCPASFLADAVCCCYFLNKVCCLTFDLDKPHMSCCIMRARTACLFVTEKLFTL